MHCESLTTALRKIPDGAPIRVVKKLRICSDCHKDVALIPQTEWPTVMQAGPL